MVADSKNYPNSMKLPPLARLCIIMLAPLSGGGLIPPATAAEPLGKLSAEQLSVVQTLFSDVRDAVIHSYVPQSKVGKEFDTRCAETEKQLPAAANPSDAYALIADTLSSLDPRIRLYPPLRAVRVDYSWEWNLIGNSAYVTRIDRVGDAAKQGLKAGDKILSFEGLTLDRGNYQQVSYAFRELAPRPGLHVQVQSPGGPPRWLSIAATIRPQRKSRTEREGGLFYVRLIPTPREKQHEEDFKNLKKHLRRIGQVQIWHTDELRREIGAIADGLKEAQGAGALVLDLRGQFAWRTETVMRLLDGLFTEDFDVGQIKRDHGNDDRLRVHGRSSAFQGTVLVLINAETSGYAELLARVIQQRQRGVIIGDRSMGRVFEETFSGDARGAYFSFSVSSVGFPTGELILADGSTLDGVGVTPDLSALPKAEDLALNRDTVLTKALAMVKQPLAPEEAFKLFWIDYDDDETF